MIRNALIAAGKPIISRCFSVRSPVWNDDTQCLDSGREADYFALFQRKVARLEHFTKDELLKVSIISESVPCPVSASPPNRVR